MRKKHGRRLTCCGSFSLASKPLDLTNASNSGQGKAGAHVKAKIAWIQLAVRQLRLTVE